MTKKHVPYDQNAADKKLTETFQMPIGLGTTEKESNDSVDKEEEEKPKRKYTKVSPTRGGARAGSGRKKGTTNKISPAELISDFQTQAGMSFEQFVNSRMLLAADEDNQELVSRYILGMAKYFITDVKEVDITSGGETMGVQIMFTTKELDDWK